MMGQTAAYTHMAPAFIHIDILVSNPECLQNKVALSTGLVWRLWTTIVSYGLIIYFPMSALNRHFWLDREYLRSVGTTKYLQTTDYCFQGWTPTCLTFYK